MSKAAQIARQERTITELWVKNARLKKRIEIQQYIIDMQRRPGHPTAKEIADAVFVEITKRASE